MIALSKLIFTKYCFNFMFLQQKNDLVDALNINIVYINIVYIKKVFCDAFIKTNC
jgi:hypothetical protein